MKNMYTGQVKYLKTTTNDFICISGVTMDNKDHVNLLKTMTNDFVCFSGVTMDNKDHVKYLKTMTNDFMTHMTDMIEKGVKERESRVGSTDPLYQECMQHIRFCQEKCKLFVGREKTLQVLPNI